MQQSDDHPRQRCAGTVAGVTAKNADGESIDLELLIVAARDKATELCAGNRRPSAARSPSWLGVSPISALTLGGRRHVGAELEKRLLPRFMTPRMRRGLMVYDGGRPTGGGATSGKEDGPSAA